MALEVIGTGFGRTGTDSMRIALDMLGVGPCHHMRALIEDEPHRMTWRAAVASGERDWDVLLGGFRSCVDWPTAQYWPELVARHPDARVLLTWRDAESWWRSFEKTIRPYVLKDYVGDSPGAGTRILIEESFGDPELKRETCIAAYEANVARVKAEVPAERLLIHKLGDGWAPLCEFLGVPVPDAPYPSANSTEEFNTKLIPEIEARSQQGA